MTTPVPLHVCMFCFPENNCRTSKHPWDVWERVSESLVGVYLSIQTAFWSEIPWKSRLCFDSLKDCWPFFPSIQITSDKQMARSGNYHWLFSVFWSPSVSFVSLHLLNLLQNVLCHFPCWNLPEPFLRRSMILTDRPCSHVWCLSARYCAHQPGGMITWPHRLLTDTHPLG